MSEPMTTHEIEDVLSSIRRLVSADQRPGARSGEMGQQSAAANPDGKLLLTPALRVVGTARVPLGAVTPATGPTMSPDAEAMAPLDATMGDENLSHGADFDLGLDDDLDAGRVVAQLGARVCDDEWESPVGDEGQWVDLGWAGAPSGAADDAKPRFIHRSRSADAPIEDVDFIAAPAAGVTEDDLLSQGPEATPDSWDVAEPDDGKGAWADQAEAAVMADLAQKLEDDIAEGSSFAGEEATFDEQVLRDLVRDLIREELAGSLGERITRNVRKLVRSEVARALATREFE